jgi:hypothetical protein
MTASKVAAETADMKAVEAADMASAEAANMAAEAAATARKRGITSQSNHYGCGDCENSSVRESRHDLFPFLFARYPLARQAVDRFSDLRCASI